MTLKLLKFYWDCGRMGHVESVFLVDEEDLNRLQIVIEKKERIYFGEILGKHSEVFGTLSEKDICVLSDDQILCKKLLEIFPRKTLSGYNPLKYLREEELD